MAEHRLRHALVAAAVASQAALPAWGTTVFVMSVGFSEVQLKIDDRNLYTLRIGDVSPEGVRLLDIRDGTAALVVDGRAMDMRTGQSSVIQAVLTADGRGHFVANARINGIPARALIDTGATFVSLNAADAQRIGVDYSQGKRGVTQTANGPMTVYLVTISHVQVGDITLANVPGLVAVEASAQQTPVLIGMSFLKHVEMRRAGNTMTLMRADR